MSTAVLSIRRPAWRLLFWRHPEWWAVVLSTGAWLFIIAKAAMELSLSPSSSAAHAGHATANSSAFPRSLPALLVFVAWPLTTHWLPMIAAMMYPTLIGQLRLVADRSFWSRRNRAIALFLLGYTVFWLSFGVFAEAVLRLARVVASTAAGYVVPACLCVAAVWQLSPGKRRSVVACHFTKPMAARGWSADLDCLRHGLRVGVRCCVSCWALMLACAAGHGIWVVVAAAIIVWSERMQPGAGQLSRSLALSSLALFAFITQSRLCP